MGHITRAREEMGEDLDVAFITATDPSVTHHGKIKEVHSIAEVRGEEGNTVLITVSLNKEEFARLQPWSTVTAKVYCGRRSIGYVWFHDLIAFVQSRIIFPLF